MKRAATQQNTDSAMLTVSAAPPVLAPAAFTLNTPQASSLSVQLGTHREESPPPFLLNEQFRI